jgi:hypothetical protein
MPNRQGGKAALKAGETRIERMEQAVEEVELTIIADKTSHKIQHGDLWSLDKR